MTKIHIIGECDTLCKIYHSSECLDNQVSIFEIDKATCGSCIRIAKSIQSKGEKTK